MTPGPLTYINLAASGAAFGGTGQFFGVILTGGSDAATAILYDSAAGSGTVICKLAAAANTTAPPLVIPNGVSVKLGVYVVLTGTAPSCSVFGG